MQTITNTFQAILITDGTDSYAVFIYECGGMEWSGGVIGWQDSSFNYASHYLSGHSDSNDIGCLYSSSYSAVVFRLECKFACPAAICCLLTKVLNPRRCIMRIHEKYACAYRYAATKLLGNSEHTG